ncbi:hypothetical protein ZOSMA_658G00020 [Zostera marina]|uniref:Uncharacterized protein n=1 Tax=Zostera marina TaxID=29655 RepID=A0A0K9NUZ3_ZOSMR|nr:hypothetical protein ZOSMA_658G00020 [Zostera marina]
MTSFRRYRTQCRDLSRNSFEGTIPANIDNLVNLTELFLLLSHVELIAASRVKVGHQRRHSCSSSRNSSQLTMIPERKSRSSGTAIPRLARIASPTHSSSYVLSRNGIT